MEPAPDEQTRKEAEPPEIAIGNGSDQETHCDGKKRHPAYHQGIGFSG
jgi:hypothetical protein